MFMLRLFPKRGDGNDGEHDALQKLELGKKAKNWLEFKKCGWLGSYFENIQSSAYPRPKIQKKFQLKARGQ